MKWLENIIDKTLDKMAKEEILMKTSDPKMPIEMFDSTIESDSDWKAWKPISSILVDSDLNRLEEMIGIKLPLSYRHFLNYKHFYELDISDFAVNLPTHLPDESLDGFKKWFFEYYESELLIEKGLIFFAGFQDYGLLCFDSNEKRKDNEYPIVYIDDEDLTTKHHYSNNFRDLMTADTERGNRFIKELNEYYKKY